MTLFFVKFPEISTGNFFQLQWEDFESFLDDTELRGYWFRRTAMLWQYDYSEIRWNKKHHWAWLFTAEYGSQVASLPSPCGRCHRALFHDSWLFFIGCWQQVRPGKCHENCHGVAWEQGQEVTTKRQRQLCIEILQVFDLWGLRNFQRGLSRQFTTTVQVVWRWWWLMRWLFGSSLFLFLFVKDFFKTLKISENIEAKTFCSGCDVSPRGGKENPAGLASCRHDKRH